MSVNAMKENIIEISLEKDDLRHCILKSMRHDNEDQ